MVNGVQGKIQNGDGFKKALKPLFSNQKLQRLFGTTLSVESDLGDMLMHNSRIGKTKDAWGGEGENA